LKLVTKNPIFLPIYRGEAESMLSKVNSGRDTGDTPGRKNYQEEAKL
jgi:hypothetical protein